MKAARYFPADLLSFLERKEQYLSNTVHIGNYFSLALCTFKSLILIAKTFKLFKFSVESGSTEQYKIPPITSDLPSISPGQSLKGGVVVSCMASATRPPVPGSNLGLGLTHNAV